jgi:hypothetical protein
LIASSTAAYITICARISSPTIAHGIDRETGIHNCHATLG